MAGTRNSIRPIGGSICTQGLWHVLRKLSWPSCAALVVLFLTVNAPSSLGAQSSSLDGLLNAWIDDDLHFLWDVNNRPKLAIRRKGIRAHIYSEIPSVADDIRLAVGLFSQAAGVPFEFTSLDPNMIAIVTTPINEGSKPNRALLRRLNFPDSAVDQVVAGSDWSTGCGLFAFGDAQGEIALSLAVADKNLSAGNLRDCISDGVVRAFGLRTKRTSVVRSADGYFQYLLLTKALRHCDGEIRDRYSEIATLKAAHSRCALEFMKKVLALPEMDSK
jgi:hypothetical protein